MRLVPDYYAGHKTREELDNEGRVFNKNDRSSDEESLDKTQVDEDGIATEKRHESYVHNPAVAMAEKPAEPSIPDAPRKWYEPAQIWQTVKWTFFRGVMIDIVSEQSNVTNEPKFLQRLLVGKNLHDKHARVEHYDNKVEHLYSFLQVMTAATASFGHGANDVANAMGPLSAIYQIWQTNTAGEDSDVPIWVLIFGGAAISIGLWTYGYNLMRNLGNRITLHSPARGFCMEVGAAVTVVLATRLALPVSTTQCIIGATVGVGLCAGDYKAINWRMVIWAYSAWFVTLPSTAVISGLLMAFTINAPQWGRTPAAVPII
ncbi:Putative phosphate transporter [Septoria linicola]|uniref:Phosphate transporter n=1 Tax=Septoria linicola TaxID=215465 RepID=A0A9Q9AYY5_9PEZI|nr:putative phosphate transporter [Septoria linicola]USW54613.1 Putative phosphate transporter [Septoria linicola]